MGNLNTRLPSPNSRRSPDPNNRGFAPDVLVTVAAVAGNAEVTLPLLGCVAGIPACTLSGGAHVGEIPCVSATSTGLASVTLGFAEPVAPGDVVTWPEKDPALRARNGAYVAAATYDTGGAVPTSPILTGIQLDFTDLSCLFTFDQDVTSLGPSLAGVIQMQTPDGVPMQSGPITAVFGAVVQCTMENSGNAEAPGTATSTGLGACVAGVFGGIPATDFAGSGVATINDNAPPLIMVAAHSGGAPPYTVAMAFSQPITPDAGTNNIVFDDGAGTFDNNAAAIAVDFRSIQCVCDNHIGGGGSANTVNNTTTCCSSVAFAVANASFIAYPCP